MHLHFLHARKDRMPSSSDSSWALISTCCNDDKAGGGKCSGLSQGTALKVMGKNSRIDYLKV